MTILISGGSTNFGPLDSALHALLKKPELDISAVWLVDNEETAQAFSDHVPKIKQVLGKADVMIATFQVSESDAFERIPDFMSQFVLRSSRDSSDVVVDLTAGPKFITSLLYAAANFCRISHIYYFLLKGDKRRVPFEELSDQDYEYLRLPPFSSESLDRLGKRSYLELISYLKEVEDLVDGYEERTPAMARRIDTSLRLSVRDYFDGNFRGSIRSASDLLETWAERLYRFWKEAGKLDQFPPSQTPIGRSGDWAFHTSSLTGLFAKLGRLKDTETILGWDDQLVAEALQIATVNDLLEAARPLRNIASHKANLGYELTRRDAKLVLDIALNVVGKCRGTRFFGEELTS